jgi:hypothetical protein
LAFFKNGLLKMACVTKVPQRDTSLSQVGNSFARCLLVVRHKSAAKSFLYVNWGLQPTSAADDTRAEPGTTERQF